MTCPICHRPTFSLRTLGNDATGAEIKACPPCAFGPAYKRPKAIVVEEMASGGLVVERREVRL